MSKVFLIGKIPDYTNLARAAIEEADRSLLLGRFHRVDSHVFAEAILVRLTDEERETAKFVRVEPDGSTVEYSVLEMEKACLHGIEFRAL